MCVLSAEDSKVADSIVLAKKPCQCDLAVEEVWKTFPVIPP